MSMLIHMKMPKDGECVVIYPDGTAHKYRAEDVALYGYGGRVTESVAVELHPHGRLIDADAFLARNAYFAEREFVNPKYDDTLTDLIDRADTIIPADPEDMKGEKI